MDPGLARKKRLIIEISDAIVHGRENCEREVASGQSGLEVLPEFIAKTEEQLLAKELKPSRESLRSAKETMEAFATWRSRIISPSAFLTARTELARAQAASDEATRTANSKQAIEARKTKASNQSDKQERDDTERRRLSTKVRAAIAIGSDLDVLRAVLEPIASSVDRGGWLAADSVPLLQSALSALKAGVLNDASVTLKKIRYQTVPLPKVLDASADRDC